MKIFRALLVLALGATGIAIATPAIVQPAEATSKDVFLYEGAAGANWNVAFGNLLVSGEHSGGHECRALVQFDLAGLSLAPGETATLNLFVGPNTTPFPFANPAPGLEITSEVHRVTSSWDENTGSWSPDGGQGTVGAPSFDASVAASAVIGSVNQWARYDITALVQGWLAAPATNFGVELIQPVEVVNPGNGQRVAALFPSSATGTAVNRPYLEIVAVPEPGTIGLLAAAGMLFVRRRQTK